MMRALVLILAIAPANADPAAAPDDWTCAIDGSAAATDALNAAIYAWAASKRCGKGSQLAKLTSGKLDKQLACTIDISETLTSVNSMINTILGAVNECGALNTAFPACGLAVSAFTQAAADLTAQVTSSAKDCDALVKPASDEEDAFNPQSTPLGDCVVDISDSLSNAFQASHAFKNVANGQRDDGCTKDICEGTVLNVIDGIAGLGGAISAATNDCSTFATGAAVGKADGQGNGKAGCVGDLLGAVSALGAIGAAGNDMAQACTQATASAKRLYEERSQVEASGPSKAALMAALPMFAVVSLIVGFVGGSRFSRYRSEKNAATDMEAYGDVRTQHILVSDVE